ncbi:MAG: CHAT domain-containing protein [Prevotellaceae bacterium]|nr:CHAT domain-containing protein [Prevotellaceae bacterium]
MKHTCIILLLGLFIGASAYAQDTQTAGGSQADAKRQEAEAFIKADDFASALPVILQALAAYEAEGRTETAEYARSLYVTGIAYATASDLDNGRTYTKRALELKEKIEGKVNEDYICWLNDYTQMLTDYEEAERIEQEVMDLCGLLPSQHPKYGTFAYNMGRYCFLNKRYAEAATSFEIALPLVEKYGTLYETMLDCLGDCYMNTNDQEGVARAMALMEDHNRHELEKECNELKCMLERAEYYYVTGDNAKAQETYLAALAMEATAEEQVEGCESYAKFLNEGLQDYTLSADYYMRAAGLLKASAGNEARYVNDVYHAAVEYFIGKQYDASIGCYREILDYYAGAGAQADMERIVECHNGMGNALSGAKRYAEAKAEYRYVVDYYQANDTGNNKYPKAVEHLATAEKFNKEFEPAIAHYKEALAMYKERGMTAEYDWAKNSLTLCYMYAGIPSDLEEDTAMDDAFKEARDSKLDGLIQDELDNLELTQTYLGEYSYASSLATIAGCYYLKEDYDNAVKYYGQYIDALRGALRDEFRLQGGRERMLQWSEQRENVDEIMEMVALLPEARAYLQGELSATAYDALLLSKGILLNSSIAFEKVLAESGDKHLQDIYRQTRQNEEEIARLREPAATDNDLEQILSLTRQNQALQLELYKGCAEYADFTDYMAYNWQDVQRALREGDVAVEFTSIETGALDNDNYMYAVVMTKESAPTAVGICNLKAAKSMERAAGLYSDADAGSLVWGPLADWLQGKSRVFFSADGVFNNIGIEYLNYQGKPLSQQMEVYRLSSTKELCRTHGKPSIENVVLFGGIDYNSLEGLSEGKRQALAQVTDGTRGSADADMLPNLKNSLREVQDIARICKEKKVSNVLLFTAAEATETAFRRLDYSKINLFHIATHGKYDEVAGADDTQSMTNSFLAFAGFNIGGDDTEENDGIVTAADVAGMNLRHCDLAVLSACETGLGKLGEDGVFGLQRGFKNAGVHTLLISLKPVNDEATTELMTGFYGYLMEGKTKREALALAQQDIRAKGFDDGRYWATFILLDAVD